MATGPESEATREDAGKWGDPRALAREGGDRLRRHPTLRERRAVALTLGEAGGGRPYLWEGTQVPQRPLMRASRARRAKCLAFARGIAPAEAGAKGKALPA